LFLVAASEVEVVPYGTTQSSAQSIHDPTIIFGFLRAGDISVTKPKLSKPHPAVLALDTKAKSSDILHAEKDAAEGFGIDRDSSAGILLDVPVHCGIVR